MGSRIVDWGRAFACLGWALALVACQEDATPSRTPDNTLATGGTAPVAGTMVTTGGTTAVAGTVATGGMVATAGTMAAATGGTGTMATGGTGTMATGGTGTMATGGTGGTTDAGTNTGGADPACLAAIMAAGTTPGACEMCLCKADACLAELMALEGDAVANDVVDCARENGCSGTCCLCGATCDPLGSNYAMGPCATQIETAAGVTPGAGALVNGSMVSTQCMDASTSCGKASKLGECTAMKCSTECATAVCE